MRAGAHDAMNECEGAVENTQFCSPDQTTWRRGGVSSPNVAVGTAPDGTEIYMMTFDGSHYPSHTDVGQAVSLDGGRSWNLGPDPAVGSPHLSCQRHNVETLGLAHESDREVFEAWVRDANDGDRMRRYSAEGSAEPPAWMPDPEEVELAGVPKWRGPESVIFDAEGEPRYRAWYTSDADQGVFTATSADGLTWFGGLLVLPAGEGGEWDINITNPSVAKVGEHFFMAYSGARFGLAPAIGLASSGDGVTWFKHEQNPILMGESGRVDRHGVNYPALLAVGSYGTGEFMLRLWYTAAGESYLCTAPLESICNGDRYSSTPAQQERILYTELRVTPPQF